MCLSFHGSLCPGCPKAQGRCHIRCCSSPSVPSKHVSTAPLPWKWCQHNSPPVEIISYRNSTHADLAARKTRWAEQLTWLRWPQSRRLLGSTLHSFTFATSYHVHSTC